MTSLSAPGCKDILKNSLDRIVVEARPEQAPVAHGNVRGADYYRTVA